VKTEELATEISKLPVITGMDLCARILVVLADEANGNMTISVKYRDRKYRVEIKREEGS